MEDEEPKMLNDLPLNSRITVHWKNGLTHRPNPQRFIYLGIQGNPDVMKRFAKDGLTQAFGIIVEPVDGPRLFKGGKVVAECIFPDNIERMETDE